MITLGAALIVLASLTADSPVTATVTLDPPVIPFHHQSILTLEIECPSDVEVKLPDFSKVIGGLDLTGFPIQTTKALENNRKRVTSVCTLEAIMVGDYPIAPLTFTWGENESLTIPSPALQVRDLTDLERSQAEQFAENAPPPTIREEWWRAYGPWVAALTGLALIAIAGVLWWKRGKRPVFVAPPTPWAIAYERLRELDQQHLPSSGAYDRYFVQLSDILRRYIEDRLHLRAPEQTTQEFLTDASKSGVLNESQQAMLAGFLRHCDRVKFARHVPSTEEMERHFTNVLEFIDQTVPKPENVEATAA